MLREHTTFFGLVILLALMACDQKQQTRTKFTITESSIEKAPIENRETVTHSESGMVLVPAGEFMMGADSDGQALEREMPAHPVRVDSFYMDIHEVTNAQFAEFVDATGYITVSEEDVDWEELKKQVGPNTPKPPDEMLKAGSLVFAPTSGPVPLDNELQWWSWVIGADWRHPKGPNSTIEGIENHPVVHIALRDALAYAKWAGKRLPTEAEWEWAALGGKNTKYAWGNQHVEDGNPKCNYWTGIFPYYNDESDGYYNAAPVGQYPANGYGIYDLSGNVWEICTDNYHEYFYKELERGVKLNPQGAVTSLDPSRPYQPSKVMKGGSYLCNDSYCASYRLSARMPFPEDSGTNHIGFRCVKSVN